MTVDGKTEKFRNVWLAPTMFGRFYGGGMIPTPEQNREDMIRPRHIGKTALAEEVPADNGQHCQNPQKFKIAFT